MDGILGKKTPVNVFGTLDWQLLLLGSDLVANWHIS